MKKGKLFGSKSLSKLLKSGKQSLDNPPSHHSSSLHQEDSAPSEKNDEVSLKGFPPQDFHWLPPQPPVASSCCSKEKAPLDIQSAVSRALGIFLPPNPAAGRINKELPEYLEPKRLKKQQAKSLKSSASGRPPDAPASKEQLRHDLSLDLFSGNSCPLPKFLDGALGQQSSSPSTQHLEQSSTMPSLKGWQTGAPPGLQTAFSSGPADDDQHKERPFNMRLRHASEDLCPSPEDNSKQSSMEFPGRDVQGESWVNELVRAPTVSVSACVTL
ncbi:hypothetical protein DUNSADRAFT_2069 [Dunaliella salina]|uniref:Encoded protein n=1 Tax=Dunaliella salina TaxID=3046 RepID=A0ABQ7FWQ4_DUNSA|nr:hypothetical protein DUNSADRAFT_2069 [Dunaliella salina]|eukprot:KAF5826778.1 hypothetical protein DUNSADRAFT_2069 [Dunaliella salina]